MPKITAYHPEIAVQKKDGSLVVIRLDMDDYYSDGEILEMLAAMTETRTIGEAVEVVEKRGMGDMSSVILSCRVEKAYGSYQFRQWNDPI